jgi:hypothetical protein
MCAPTRNHSICKNNIYNPHHSCLHLKILFHRYIICQCPWWPQLLQFINQWTKTNIYIMTWIIRTGYDHRWKHLYPASYRSSVTSCKPWVSSTNKNKKQQATNEHNGLNLSINNSRWAFLDSIKKWWCTLWKCFQVSSSEACIITPFTQWRSQKICNEGANY